MRRIHTVICIAVSAVLLANIAAVMPQANADQVNITMKIVNTEHDTIKVVPLGNAYGFEHNIIVDVTDMQLHKIDKIFGQTNFTFQWSSNNFEAQHYPWDVSISAPVQVGSSLKVKFV